MRSAASIVDRADMNEMMLAFKFLFVKKTCWLLCFGVSETRRESAVVIRGIWKSWAEACRSVGRLKKAIAVLRRSACFAITKQQQ